MAIEIDVAYDKVYDYAVALNKSISVEGISKDGVSNISAVENGYTQGNKSIELGGNYQQLLNSDAQKISTLGEEYKDFDQQIANAMRNK